MSKHRILLFCPEQKKCIYHDYIFNKDYEILTTNTEKQFFSYLKKFPVDAAIICFYSAEVQDVAKLLSLDALTGPIPVMTCSKDLNPEFIRVAAQRGISRFVVSDMGVEKVKDIIIDAICNHGLREFLNVYFSNGINLSPYISKLIDEIVYNFPYRLNITKSASRLGIDRGWLYKLCIQTLGKSPTSLLRTIWVHQALRMMQHTSLDNLDIALHLNYSEESSMARDFHKELGCNPTEARVLLTNHSPEELLN
jgi:AraC-like DNA-binding protein